LPRIYVQFSGLDQIGTNCKTIASTVSSIESDFQSTIRALDWDVRYEADINNTAKHISRKLEQQANALRSYQRFISEAYNAYVKLDIYKSIDFTDHISPAGNLDSKWPYIIVGPDGQLEIDWTQLFKNIIITKPRAVPGLLPLVAPLAGLLYITSGIPFGNTPSFFDYSRSPSSDADADWLGYEIDGAKITAYGGKAYAQVQNEAAYAGVNGYLGQVDAGLESDFSFMETKTKKEYKDGKWTEKTTTEFLNAEIGAGVDVSIVAADGEAGIGSDMLGAEVSGEGALGNAELSGKGEFSVGEDGIELNAKGKAMVSAAEGEVEGTINILGLEITGTLGGYAGGLGVEGEIGLDDGKFKIKGGAAALLGGSVGLEIGFNETGWDNFVDAITFWD